MIFYRKLLVYSLGINLIIGCSNNSSENYTDEIKGIQVDLDTIIDGRVSKSILKSIPTPVEINTYILESQAKYHKDMLSDVDDADEYLSTHKKSLNLGVYSADMAYINLHKKYRDAFSYFSAVRSLTSDLNISTLFDLQKLKYYAENMHDNDSLIFVLSKDFDFMVSYLNENNKSDVAVLMITGGFIESLHIAVSVYGQTGNKKLEEKIIEQKLVISDIISVIKPFAKDKIFIELLNDLKDLEKAYSSVSINRSHGEASFHEEDGALVIDDTSESSLEYSQEQLETIIEKIKKIRSDIITI